MVAGLNYPTATGGATSPGILTLTSAPNGGWTTQQHAKALYYNGYTYLTWIHGTTGASYVASYNHTTDAVSTPVQIDAMDAGDPDTHEAAGMLVRASDHKLIVAFCLHDGPSMFIRISTTSLDTDPTLVDGFAAAVNLDASIGAFDYTYPALFQLTNGDIYLFYRDISAGNTGRLSFTKSTDSGATWAARQHVVQTGLGERAYWCVRASGNRIDILTTDRDAYGTEGVVDLGHMYIDGAAETYHASDGTEITTIPNTMADMTLLETDVAAAFVMDGISGTNPVFGYFVDNGDSTVTAKYARWDGAAWDKADIDTLDHFPVDRFFGGIAINRADPEEVFIGVKTGTSTSELYTYVSADLGATWDGGTAVTSGSGDLNASATAVELGDATLPVVWLRGTLTTSHNFSFGIRGLVR